MAYAQKLEGVWTAVAGGEPVQHGDVIASYETVMSWPKEEREAFGIYEIADGGAPPEGQRVVSSTIGDREGRPVWVSIFEPITDEPAPGLRVLYPADLWRRSSDAEAEAIDAAIKAQPLRIRRLFEKAQTYQSDDPLWPLLTDAAVQLFGVARAAELLAPS